MDHYVHLRTIPSMTTSGAPDEAWQRLPWPWMPPGNPGAVSNPGKPQTVSLLLQQPCSVQDDTLVPVSLISGSGESLSCLDLVSAFSTYQVQPSPCISQLSPGNHLQALRPQQPPSNVVERKN